MLWEVEIRPVHGDPDRDRVAAGYDLLTCGTRGRDVVLSSARGYLLETDDDTAKTWSDLGKVEPLREVLFDPVVEKLAFGTVGAGAKLSRGLAVTVLPKPGVMDPVAQSVIAAAADLGVRLAGARTFRRYWVDDEPDQTLLKVLANDAIEQVVVGPFHLARLDPGSDYTFRLVTVPLRGLDDDGALEKLSRDGQLALNLQEMRTVRDHFAGLDRDPTDAELETIAQTWSEHCSHKTLKGAIEFECGSERRRYANLLKETIFGATQLIRRRLGADDWCVSVFEDNAGVVTFDEKYNVCFKVETHNHPSAIEPYGGANTGLGGVIRDPLGTGLGAKPVCNTDVFCFAPLDTPPEQLPPGVLHPRLVMEGVVAGVRDYGNRMGIPTVNGAICFDPRYLGNPLVYCGTVGLIPVDRCRKQVHDGDLIVAVGGRTGRDGIHGATFSSVELTAESDAVSGGAVQIGNPITEKKVLDVLLQARDRDLYHAITDCGAGGFSSAVGEMAADLGASVHLDQVPLKYAGLSYTEIWISEAQERMVLAVPADRWEPLKTLCESEGVEASVLGRFEATGRLKLSYRSNPVADLDLRFLHDGRPGVVRKATWSAPPEPAAPAPGLPVVAEDLTAVLLQVLASPDVRSKEWVIRQYDHEVQGGSVIKPLVGVDEDGPGDAAVVMPVLGSWRGIAVGCGINPRYGDLDPYKMAAAVIDEAVRNVVAVGADPRRIALLDNFCWGNTDRPEVLGSLVRAAEACRDVAIAFDMPFISGKDSLKNEYTADGRRIVIPPTLLISALGQVPDVRGCVTMDLKGPQNPLFLVGVTRNELAGSQYHLVTGGAGGEVPAVDLETAPRVFRAVHRAIRSGLVRACHDVSDGGLITAVAEMAFAGGFGADLTLSELTDSHPAAVLFSESPTRFVIEVESASATELGRIMGDETVPCRVIGVTRADGEFRVSGAGRVLVSARLDDLKRAWQTPLD